MKNNTNVAQLAGKLTALNKIWNSADHVTYEGVLEVVRDSGGVDCIILLITDNNTLQVGSYYEVSGQFRSRDVDNNGKLKVQLYVYVQRISVLPIEVYSNDITLTGYICKSPTLRTTPSGKQISDLLVACNYSSDKSAYIPVITWGKTARKSGKLSVGTLVSIHGRVQSRKYTKQIDGVNCEFTAYELSANSVDSVVTVD